MGGTLLDMPAAVKRTRRGWLAAGALLLLLASATACLAGAEEPSEPEPARSAFEPGHGLQLGRTGLRLGGYTNLNLSRPEGGPARLGLDDLSLFVGWDPIPRLHLFSELEFEDLLEVDDHGHGGTRSWEFTAERLYADVTLSDALTLRVGKFLTPVGRWNVIHAQPLVWTTSRPLVTETPFDPHTTGLMLTGALYPGAGTVTYSLYGQVVNQLTPLPTSQAADRSVGARAQFDAPFGWSVGASYLASERRGAWRHLAGLDGLWRRGPLEMMGEATYEDATRRRLDQWGLYLQAAYEVRPRIYLVGRYEHFDRAAARHSANLYVAGIAFKPVSWLTLKAEYLVGDHRVEESPPGLRASVALLF